MRKISLPFLSFLLSLGVTVYVVLVAWVMQHGEQWFGQMSNLSGPVAFLMLFTISAAIVGGLVLGYPAYLFFNGQKKEGLRLLGYTMSFLVFETILIFAGLAMTS